jgi:outer membrane protein OmpA-like peptidoglycan-associated protein
VEVVVSVAGGQRKLRTDRAGVARVDGVHASFASVRVASIAAVRTKLRPRWARAREGAPPEDAQRVLLGIDDGGSTSLSPESPRTIAIVRDVPRVRLIGMHFDSNKCFLKPSAMRGIRRVVDVYAAIPNGNVLILGHTDTVYEEGWNLDLSLERAEAVRAFLKDDAAAWELWYSHPHEKKVWGAAEDVAMMSALPCVQSVAGFQQWSNEARGTSLVVDGHLGKKTRRALIEAYMALDGTTLPKSIGAAVHGCGEYFPRKDYGDAVEEEENRRVEILCFDDAIVPSVPGKKARKGEPEYPAWMRQVTRTIDVGGEGAETPLFISVYGPEAIATELLLCDAAGTVLRTLAPAMGRRTDDTLTFEFDPRRMPNPTQLRVRWGHRLEDLGAPFDPIARARALKAGATQAKGGEAMGADSAAAAATAPQTIVRVTWQHPSHPLLVPIELTLTPLGGIPITVKPGATGVATLKTPGVGGTAVLGVRIPDPLPGSPRDILRILQPFKIGSAVTFTQDPRVKIDVLTVTDGLAAEIEVALDLSFLDITEHAKRLPNNDTFAKALDGLLVSGDLRNELRIFEHTAGHPTTWAIVLPSALDRSAQAINLFVYFRNEILDHITPSNTPGNGGYSDYRSLPYTHIEALLGGTRQGKYPTIVHGRFTAAEFPALKWDVQIAAAAKPVLVAFPMPNGGTSFGGLGASPTARPILSALLRALWGEGALAKGQVAEGPFVRRLAVAGWSSGNADLNRWIATDDGFADVAYFFDGREEAQWPGRAKSPGRTLEQWMNKKAGRRLMLLGTSYSEEPCFTEVKALGPKFPGRVFRFPVLASGVDPETHAYGYWYENADYENALCLADTREFFEVAAPAAGTVLGREALFNWTHSATRVTGIFLSEHPSNTGVANNPFRDAPSKADGTAGTKVFIHSELAWTDPVSGLTHKHVVPRMSLGECSLLVRYIHLPFNGDVIPPTTKDEFMAIARRLDDRAGSEPNAAGRLRHEWSVMGGHWEGGIFKGHLQMCLENSDFK